MEQEQQLSFLLERQLKMLIDISTKKYDKEIADLKAQNASMKQDIEVLRASVKNSRVEHAPQSIIHQVPSQPIQQTESSANAHQEPVAGETVSLRMARTGNYKSEDVSVDKFFYYGNKR